MHVGEGEKKFFLTKYFSIFYCSAAFMGVFEKNQKHWDVSLKPKSPYFSDPLVCISDFFFSMLPQKMKNWI